MDKEVNEETFCYLIVSWHENHGRWKPIPVGELAARSPVFITLRAAMDALEKVAPPHVERTKKYDIVCVPMPPPPEGETPL